MKSDDLNEFSALLNTVASFYQCSISEMGLELYWKLLIEFPLHEIKAALKAHLSHPGQGKFMPKPADILRYLKGDTEAQALQAWTRVLETIRRVGSYESVIFDDGILHQVIEEMGGWVFLGQKTEKELVFVGHEFKKRYESYLLHPLNYYPKQLTGYCEHQNSLNGHKTASPLLIGDQEKAKQVYQLGRLPGPRDSIVRLSDALPALVAPESKSCLTQTDPPPSTEEEST